jgi:cation diffusion facilitator CzcD-associated flavoprotein CzcO
MPRNDSLFIFFVEKFGLAISYYLQQEGREHLVLERAPAIANLWRNQRWDSSHW